MATFSKANILLPHDVDMEKWAVIACDQFTSQPEYWQEAEKIVGDAPSTLNMILPEAFMDQMDAKIDGINQTMVDYQNGGVFDTYKNSYVYVERTLVNGTIRKGIVGKVDLEDYDYSDDASTPVRATEKTVPERIPPRMNIRRNASIELPHILLLCNDDKHELLESVESIKESLPKLYDLDLMEDGGHIVGYLVEGDVAEMFDKKLTEYEQYCADKYAPTGKAPLIYAMGDGNHSLATAKACYEEIKKNNPGVDMSNHPARYALLELENIHDDSQVFEPIHRVITGVDVEKLCADMFDKILANEGHPIILVTKEGQQQVFLNKELGELPIAILQKYLDEYLSENAGEIDYIHGDDTVVDLSMKDNAIGFLLPGIGKSELFSGIVMDGVLPRKTFSMGHACEKRYYMEGREIK